MSSIELLRIVSMFLVLIVHSNFKSIQAPTEADIADVPVISFMRFFIQALSVVCVNLFVLTSGWFGINVNKKRFSGFLFQIVFFIIIGYLIYFFLGGGEWKGFKQLCLDLWYNSSYWFIRSYIILYFLSPILNVFVAHSNSKQLLNVILYFFICQLLFGWYFDSVKWYANGYSPLSFVGLYLLARYLNLYFNYHSLTERWYIITYLFLALVMAGLSILFGDRANSLYTYNSPIVIVSTVSLFLFFTRLKIQSEIINNIGKSCFAVYLLHCHPILFENIYCSLLNKFYNDNSYIIYLLYSIVVAFIVFIISVLLDKIRIVLWRQVESCIIDNENIR